MGEPSRPDAPALPQEAAGSAAGGRSRGRHRGDAHAGGHRRGNLVRQRAPTAGRGGSGRRPARGRGSRGRPCPPRGAARAGQVHRPRAHREGGGPRYVRGAGPARRAPPFGPRPRPAAVPRRRRGDRLRDDRRAACRPLRAGLHGARRLVLRGPGREGRPPPRGRHRRRAAHGGAARLGRSAHPGGGVEPGGLRRPLLAQHAGQRRRAADQRHARALRRRGRVLPGADRFRHHDARQQPHVHHRARRHPDRHR